MTVIMAWRQYPGLLTVLTTITIFSISVADNCALKVNEPGKQRPLLVEEVITPGRTTYQLFRFKRWTLYIKRNKKLLLACPGSENGLVSTNEKWNIAQCVQQNTLRLNNGVQIECDRLKCITRPQASLQISSEQCFSNNGVIIHIGFEVNNNWYPILEVCHNIQISQTYYVKHDVIIPTTPCNKIPTKRPDFKNGDDRLCTGLDMKKIYSISNQQHVLQRMIGTNATKYINKNENKTLSRGHLAPDADFPIDAWRTLTYFYINLAPQWQSINGGIWSRLEREVRNLSRKMRQLNVITGTHGIMEIEGRNFYLANERVPVPEYFWKLLHIAADDSCIGFITKNDPFLSTGQPQENCKDNCSSYNWNVINDSLFDGYIYCCEYSNFRNVITEVPNVTCHRALFFH